MSTSEAPPLRFFEGFEWAVPTAFAAALAANRFEQGDVLFREAAAYAPIEASIPPKSLAIQVLEPPRSARTAASTAETDGDRRQASWQSEVQIELIDLCCGERELRTLSQGKLITALWRGDLSWLDSAGEEPPLPRAARDLAQALPEATATLDAAQTTKRGCRFVFVVDLSSDGSRVKAQTIEEALAALGPPERIDLSPLAAGLEDASTYHPALVIRSVALAGVTEAEVEATLKKSLYGGSSERGAEPDSEARSGVEAPAKTDRFSVARHGRLEAIGK